VHLWCSPNILNQDRNCESSPSAATMEVCHIREMSAMLSFSIVRWPCDRTSLVCFSKDEEKAERRSVSGPEDGCDVSTSIGSIVIKVRVKSQTAQPQNDVSPTPDPKERLRGRLWCPAQLHPRHDKIFSCDAIRIWQWNNKILKSFGQWK